MVAVKRCPACGCENSPQNFFCTSCPTNLAMVQIAEVDGPDGVESAIVEDQGCMAVCPYCGTKNLVDATSCIRCGMPMIRHASPESERASTAQQGEGENVTRREESCQVVVRFPWGTVVVDRRLGIGRDSNHSSLAGRLADFRRVSRRHAEILLEGGRAMIRDLDSLNSTFVNGHKLSPNEAMELQPGDRMQFSSQLEAEVLEIRGRS